MEKKKTSTKFNENVFTTAKKINCFVVIGFDFTQAYNRKEDGVN